MFFTQDDYRKIQEWLQRNSVKDTEFQEADIPLNGNEIITLTQNSHSRKVYLKDLIEQIFSLGITDFVNVSSLHDKYNITLNEAIQLVPHRSRKKGQVITFCNTDNVWKIYQFTGVKNQWNILDLWNDLFDWTTILDVNFGPDEEDITANKSEDNIKLSFKDRVYEPDSHSGLGYKILRKNIVTYNDPTQGELTKNILVQDKVAQSNTIYEIRYDFDLNSQTINIPENSVLQYKGGSLNNGKIVYNNTIIEGIERLNNVTTEGDYTYPYTGDETNSDEQLAPTLSQLKKLSTEVTNIADDEDLTKIYDPEKGQEVLQLKDRKYVQGTNSGMGYVILRQNKSFKEQVTKANTIYEIRYDFNLGGATISIPENCVLKFNGGKLINGKINTNYECLIAGELNAVFDSVVLAGSYKNSECNLVWWGAKKGEGIDNSNAIQCAFSSSIPIINVSGKYYMSSPVSLPYNKVIKGRTGNNNLITGFIANNNFSSKEVNFPARYGKDPFTQEVFGMFYHRDTTKLEMHDIFIDCAYHANYAIEHIDLYGSCDMYNCYISKANNVGILQYACENPIYDQLYITDCHIGLVVSTNSYIDKINGKKTNPMELECFTSEIQGSPNIIYTSNLRCLNNNYGAIFNGCSDIKFESFETAHNSIVGAIINKISTCAFSKYYSEGDADCDFYIHDGYKDTVIERISNGESLEIYSAHPLLTTSDLDGKLAKNQFLFINSDGTNKKTKTRAPLLFMNSNAVITSALISINPRSKEMDNPSYYELPTEENIYGVDALLMSYSSNLNIWNVSPYVAPNNTSPKTYYTRYIDLKESVIFIGAEKPIFHHKFPITPMTQNATSRTYQEDKYYSDRRMYKAQYYAVDDNFANLNTDIETRRYDLYYQAKDFRVAKILSHWNNIPLYGGEKLLTRGLYFSKDKFLQRFGALRVVKIYGIIEVLSEVESFRPCISATFYKDNYSTAVKYFSNDSGGIIQNKKGIYELNLFVPIITDPDIVYDNVVIQWDGIVKKDTVAYSDLFFYDVTDNTPYSYQNETLHFGNTEQRPDPSYIGQRYFDTTLIKDIIWTGTNWVDTTGAEV